MQLLPHLVSNQLISLASRESKVLRNTIKNLAVSNQLISLASREPECGYVFPCGNGKEFPIN